MFRPAPRRAHLFRKKGSSDDTSDVNEPHIHAHAHSMQAVSLLALITEVCVGLLQLRASCRTRADRRLLGEVEALPLRTSRLPPIPTSKWSASKTNSRPLARVALFDFHYSVVLSSLSRPSRAVPASSIKSARSSTSDVTHPAPTLLLDAPAIRYAHAPRRRCMLTQTDWLPVAILRTSPLGCGARLRLPRNRARD